MEYLVFFLLLGSLTIIAGEKLAGYSLQQLLARYQKQKENPVAFELIERYRTSDTHNQGNIIWTLLAAHQDDLSKIVASMNEDPQEELQKLFLKLHQLFLKGKFPATNWKYWLARILKNDLINKKKKKNPIVSLPLEYLPEMEEDTDGTRTNTQRLYQAIDQLTETQKQVIQLRYLKREDKLMTYKEIARIMNCSVGQVHGYLDRAKENLRNQMVPDELI